ncbi:MAG: hypothetical protein J5649_10895 [Lachnospiraceae bacterium]|nr:hypothetical protein [Lachnospiraceae bacterium]
MTIPVVSEYFFGSVIIVIVLIMFACLLRAIRGPEIADRIVAVNMLGTLTIMVICILSLWQNESYLLDVALIYAMISFLAVVVLTRVYLGVHREHLMNKKNRELYVDFADGESADAAASDAVSGALSAEEFSAEAPTGKGGDI